MTEMQEAKLPYAIDIGPHQFLVVTNELDMLRKIKEQKTVLMGHLDIGMSQLYVSTEYSPSQQRDTLLHEVLHGIIDQTNLDFGKKTEEDVICRLTPLLLDVLRRNPDLIRCLLQDSGYRILLGN